jgi:hypothetical protein
LPPLNTTLVAVLSLALLGWALPANASQEETFTLSWQAPDGCPATSDVRAEVARLLGGEILLPASRRFKAVASVVHGPIWSVSIETELAGRSGRRTLEAASCQEVADATALILALTIDPDVAASHATRQQLPAPSVSADTRPSPPKVPAPVDFLLGVQGTGNQGTLPSVDVGLGGSVGVVGRRFRVELRGAYSLRRDQVADAPAPSGAYGRFNLVAATLAGCFNLGRQAWAFGPCADAELGVVSAQGFRISQSISARSLWVAMGAGGYAAISLGPHWSVPLHLDVLAPLARPEFVFTNVPSRVFQAPPVGVRVSAGVELHF